MGNNRSTENRPTFFHSLDWNRTLVGGSYALQQFLQHSRLGQWTPNDVDVMVVGDANQIPEFDNYVASVVNQHQGAVLKSRVTSIPIQGVERTSFIGEEEFHRDIFKTYTVSFPGFSLPVQFVGIHLHPGENLRDKLTQITDVPSSVTFSLDTRGERVYQIPEKILSPLFTGIVNEKEICPQRKEKYTHRGFIFVDPPSL